MSLDNAEWLNSHHRVRRMALGLLIAACSFSAVALLPEVAEAAGLPDVSLAPRPPSASRPAPIPQIHRKQKIAVKRRAALPSIRPLRKKLSDLVGSSLAQCGGTYEPSFGDLVDDFDDDASIDELEIDSISYAPLVADDQKRVQALPARMPSRSFEKLVYASDLAVPVVEVVDRPDPSILHTRLLPSLPPSSSDDGSASA